MPFAASLASQTESMPPLRRFLLTRAFWNLAGFSLAALIFMPSISGGSGLSSPFAVRARILLIVGSLLWISTLIACLQAFRIPGENPSISASFTFFLLLGLELLVLYEAARI
jgi:hypothetical protein